MSCDELWRPIKPLRLVILKILKKIGKKTSSTFFEISAKLAGKICARRSNSNSWLNPFILSRNSSIQHTMFRYLQITMQWQANTVKALRAICRRPACKFRALIVCAAPLQSSSSLPTARLALGFPRTWVAGGALPSWRRGPRLPPAVRPPRLEKSLSRRPSLTATFIRGSGHAVDGNESPSHACRR